MIVYAVIFSVGALYILRLMDRGPSPADAVEPAGQRPPGYALGASPDEAAP
jgi:hypothetical protein